MRRDEVSKQIAGFKQEWFGRMHRIDKFFHRVRPPPGAKMNTHKGVTPVPLLSAFFADFYSADADPTSMCRYIDAVAPAAWIVSVSSWWHSIDACTCQDWFTSRRAGLSALDW